MKVQLRYAISNLMPKYSKLHTQEEVYANMGAQVIGKFIRRQEK
jgi:hypothetical protein